MVKLTHLFILSALMVWLAGSGCVGNEASEANEESEIGSNAAEIEEGTPTGGENGLNEAEIQALDADMAELEALLENASLEESIAIEDL